MGFTTQAKGLTACGAKLAKGSNFTSFPIAATGLRSGAQGGKPSHGGSGKSANHASIGAPRWTLPAS